MSDYDDTNRGALFKNKQKGDNEKAPDYKGSINVGGTDYWLSSWLRVSKDGQTYMSLSVQAKDEQPKAKPAQRPQQRRQDDNEDIPF